VPAQSVDVVTVTVPLDPYLSLRALSAYAGLSTRTLRGYLTDGLHPLPCYRVGGRVLVRRSEFDGWVRRYRSAGRVDIDQAVDEILREL
jgi:Helix-turn-helix domain